MFGNKILRSGKIHTLVTNPDGVTFTAFPSREAVAINVKNISGVDIEYRRNNGPETISIPAKQDYFIIGIENINEIEILAPSEATVKAESFTVLR